MSRSPVGGVPELALITIGYDPGCGYVLSVNPDGTNGLIVTLSVTFLHTCVKK